MMVLLGVILVVVLARVLVMMVVRLARRPRRPLPAARSRRSRRPWGARRSVVPIHKGVVFGVHPRRPLHEFANVRERDPSFHRHSLH